MARPKGARPARTLIVLAALLAVLYGGLALANQFSNAPSAPKLGLDLEGGTEIILDPVLTSGATVNANQINQAITVIRDRVNGSGISEADVTSQGSNNIVVDLPGTPDQKTIDLVKQSSQLRIRAVLAAAPATPNPAPSASSGTPTPSTLPTTPAPGSTPSGGTKAPGAATSSGSGTSSGSAATPSSKATTSSAGRAVPQALVKAAGSTPTPTKTPSSPASPSSKASPTPTPTPSATTPAPSAQPKNGSDTAWITPAIAQQFKSLTCANTTSLEGDRDNPNKPLVTCSSDKQQKFILGPVEVGGQYISDASASLQTNQQGVSTGQWGINLTFTGAGVQEFRKVTTRLYNLGDQNSPRNQFAVELNGLVLENITSQVPITDGRSTITGSFTEASAKALANQLKYGALPLSFKVQTQQHISPTIGSSQLKWGLIAGLIGLLLVILYALAQYRALGLVTILSLGLAAAVTYAVICLLGWKQGFRLSLAGVTGLIVSIGITADSFIVFFERVRDEVRDGRSLRSAVETGWNRARRTIFAADAVNFLAAATLFILAVGNVKGFAYTLGLTTLIDIVIVVLFTHPVVALLARTKFFGGGHKLSGFDPAHLGARSARRRRTIAEARAEAASVGAKES